MTKTQKLLTPKKQRRIFREAIDRHVQGELGSQFREQRKKDKRILKLLVAISIVEALAIAVLTYKVLT